MAYALGTWPATAPSDTAHQGLKKSLLQVLATAKRMAITFVGLDPQRTDEEIGIEVCQPPALVAKWLQRPRQVCQSQASGHHCFISQPPSAGTFTSCPACWRQAASHPAGLRANTRASATPTAQARSFTAQARPGPKIYLVLMLLAPWARSVCRIGPFKKPAMSACAELRPLLQALSRAVDKMKGLYRQGHSKTRNALASTARQPGSFVMKSLKHYQQV